MMSYKRISLSTLALTVLAGCMAATNAEDATQHKMHDGKVVSVTSTSLTMTGREGKEHSHTLSPDTKLTLDGKACKAADLKVGTRIRVTTKAGDTKLAINVEGIDHDKLFANTHDGKVVTITAEKLVMTGKDGKPEHSHAVSKNTQVTCDGKECKATDLKVSMKIRVTTEPKGGAALIIEAIDKDADFARQA
ncbi:MAG: hypothetical protein RIK87_18895 [Fuerstiella sp.]